jgi:hypothetical protein
LSESYDNLVCMDLGLRGPDLLDYIIEQIEHDPESWNQKWYHKFNCDSSHCIAGFAQLYCGEKPPKESLDDLGYVNCHESERCRSFAREALRLNYHQALWLFSWSRSLGEIKDFAKRFREDSCTEVKP